MDSKYQKFEEKLRKLERNREKTTPEQRRTIYKKQFENYERQLARDASDILRQFLFSGMLFSDDCLEHPEKKKVFNMFIRRAGVIVKEETANGEMRRLGRVLSETLSIESFLDAASERLWLRIWYEAYSLYWVTTCEWDKQQGAYRNDLLGMYWDPACGVWIAPDKASWTIMLPPTLEEIRRYIKNEQINEA